MERHSNNGFSNILGRRGNSRVECVVGGNSEAADDVANKTDDAIRNKTDDAANKTDDVSKKTDDAANSKEAKKQEGLAEGRAIVAMADQAGMDMLSTEQLLKGVDRHNSAITGVYHRKNGSKVDFYMTASPGHYIGTLQTKEEYETDDLSKRVLEERKNTVVNTPKGNFQGDFGSSNYAVYEYEEEGVMKYVVRKSGRENGIDVHSEEYCEKYLKENGITNDKVKRIYSERSPCFGDKSNNCSTRISSNFPNAQVTYTFEYGTPNMNSEFRKFMELLKSKYQKTIP